MRSFPRRPLRCMLPVLLVAAYAAPTAHAAFPGDNGPLMFSSNRNGALDLFCLDPDEFGGGPAPAGSAFSTITMAALNVAGRDDYSPNWSPDGTKVAFNSTRTGDNEIYVYDRVAKTTTRLTNSPKTDDTYPYWNRMGTQLSFQRASRGGKPDLWVMNANGSGQVNITNTKSVGERWAIWSPVAREIVYTSDRDGDYEIHRRNLDTNADVKLTNNKVADWRADWSPDGTRLVFVHEPGAAVETGFGDQEIWVMNADGTLPRLLVDRGVADKQVAWSPDGNEIAWISSTSGALSSEDWEIYEMNVDGTNLKQLTFNSSGDFQPAYRSDPVPAP